MRKRIEASLQAAQTEARAAMERHRTTIELVAAVLSERRELDTAQIAGLLAEMQVKPVRTDAMVPAGAK